MIVRCDETVVPDPALYDVTSANLVSQEDLKLEFVRQIYKECRERRGDDDPQTRLIQKYITVLERQHQAYRENPPQAMYARFTA